MICIPIAARTHAGAMRAIERSVAVADVIELRMDLIHKGRLVELIEQVRACDEAVEVLVTHRPQAGGDSSQERSRIDCLKEAVFLGADYVDVEIETKRALRDDLREAIVCLQHRTALIVSHHDFERTPPLKALRSLFRRCIQAGADIVKIVTWAENPQDNLRVLGLVADAGREDINLVSFCMGPQGRISRIVAPMLGSYLSYVSLRRGGQSASGQLTVTEMNKIMDILRRAP
ncbi:MAG: type I 3-dehydroquinate dehydratase [Syntrophus sp. (in: bacteria)]|nr:type I 3-dehydroquinate dehydratase [Syntrophus sp. (in: bacteria)]